MEKLSLSGALTIGMLAIAACGEQMTTQPKNATPLSTSRDQSNDADADGGGVFTSSNSAAGNVVVAFARNGGGVLTKTGEFPTGGNGVGGGVDPLQSQNSVVLGEGHQRLYVVNAGSNSVSTFAVAQDATLRLLGTVPSAGNRPISLAVSRHRLFVLNSDNSVISLALDDEGVPRTSPVGSVSLGDASDGPSTIAASANGDLLFVTQRSANAIDVLRADEHGSLSPVGRQTSSGASPFGFAVTRRSQLIVSEAAGDAPNGAASSYDIGHDGTLTTITSSVSTHQAAACWLVLTDNDHFAFVANAGSGSISGYAVGTAGTLTALDASGRTGVTNTADATPLDMNISRNGNLLYVLQTGTGTIGTFRIGIDGHLTALPDTPGLAAAAGFQGLAAY
jgi:6-phosphogluconolactonase